LFSFGLLAYVTVELVEPDLADDRASGSLAEPVPLIKSLAWELRLS
jgi:hypothetical protein